MPSIYEYLPTYLRNADNPNLKALLDVLDAKFDSLTSDSVWAAQQLQWPTADSANLLSHLSNGGMSIVWQHGLDAQQYRSVAAATIASPRQITATLWKLLESIYTKSATRARIVSAPARSWTFSVDDELHLETESGSVSISFAAVAGRPVTAPEIAAAINRLRLPIVAESLSSTGGTALALYSAALGQSGYLIVTGGTAQAVLRYPLAIGVDPAPGTLWEVSKERPWSDQIRFELIAGPNPGLSNILNGDVATIRGLVDIDNEVDFAILVDMYGNPIVNKEGGLVGTTVLQDISYVVSLSMAQIINLAGWYVVVQKQKGGTLNISSAPWSALNGSWSVTDATGNSFTIQCPTFANIGNEKWIRSGNPMRVRWSLVQPTTEALSFHRPAPMRLYNSPEWADIIVGNGKVEMIVPSVPTKVLADVLSAVHVRFLTCSLITKTNGHSVWSPELPSGNVSIDGVVYQAETQGGVTMLPEGVLPSAEPQLVGGQIHFEPNANRMTVRCSHPHALKYGDSVRISGASSYVGIPSGLINGLKTIVKADSFTFTVENKASFLGLQSKASLIRWGSQLFVTFDSSTTVISLMLYVGCPIRLSVGNVPFFHNRMYTVKNIYDNWVEISAPLPSSRDGLLSDNALVIAYPNNFSSNSMSYVVENLSATAESEIPQPYYLSGAGELSNDRFIGTTLARLSQFDYYTELPFRVGALDRDWPQSGRIFIDRGSSQEEIIEYTGFRMLNDFDGVLVVGFTPKNAHPAGCTIARVAQDVVKTLEGVAIISGSSGLSVATLDYAQSIVAAGISLSLKTRGANVVYSDFDIFS